LFEKKQIFCGIEERELRIPSPLVDEMKSMAGRPGKVWIYDIFVKNNSRSVCMNPTITIRLWADILDYVVNDTNEDKIEVEESISIPEWGVLKLKPERIGSNSFIDITVWADSAETLSEETVSFSSGGDFELKTKFISFRSGAKRFK